MGAGPAWRLVVVTGLVVLMAAPVSLIEPEPAAAQPACSAYLMTGSRGSGQEHPREGVKRGLGNEINHFYEKLLGQFPGGELAYWPNPYPAVSVPVGGIGELLDLIRSPTQRTALHIRSYHESVSDGVLALGNELAEIRARCPQTKVILAGYSQGANVAADVYESLDAAQRESIFAVALFADPYFYGRSQANRGSYSPFRHGLLTAIVRRRQEFADVDKVLSFCHATDPVCQGLLGPIDVFEHLSYHTFGDAASPVPYTERAADCIAYRAGHPDAEGAPVAKVTPVGSPLAGEEFELSGAQSLDPNCEPLGFSWNIDGAGFDEPTRDSTRTVTLPAGTHTVELRVTTLHDEEATDRVTFEVVAPGAYTGAPEVPTNVVSTPAADRMSATLTWQPPARGPPVEWYSVATTDGFPLYVTPGNGTRSLTLPADTLPVTVVVAAHNRRGAGPPATPVTMAAAELVAGGDLNALWRAYGDAGGHWTGGDRTASIELPDERIAWLFSDTYLGTVNPDRSRPHDSPMVHNSLVVQETSGQLGRTLHGGSANAPTSLVEVAGSDLQYWVADGHVAGNRLQVLYNTYRVAGDGALDVVLTGTSLVTFSLPDLAVTDIQSLPLGAEITWGSAVLDDGRYTYVYGSEDPGDGVRFAHVARVGRGNLDGPWEFWDGTGWSDDEAASTRLFRGVGTAYDVMAAGDGYVLVTQDSNIVFSPAFVAYAAATPAGPFSGPTYLFEAPTEYPHKPVIAYDAHIHTAFSRGGQLTISYNVNSLDSDDNYADAHIYRPRFVNVGWPRPLPDQPNLPPSPTDLTASLGDQGLVRLAWRAPPGATPGLRYRIYQRDMSAEQDRFARYAVKPTVTWIDLPFLKDGNVYEFRVTAENDFGESPPSNTARLTVDFPPPPAPANLRATPTGNAEIRLDWDATSDNVLYTVYERNMSGGEPDFISKPVSTLGSTSLTVGPLNSGDEYEFKVTARHGGGESPPSNLARATAIWPRPPMPTGLSAESQPDGAIKLSWNAPAAGLWYWVEMRDVTPDHEEEEFTRVPHPVVDTSFTAGAEYLLQDHLYEFRVASTNRGGDSEPTAPVLAWSRAQRPPTPTGLRATANDDGSIALTWNSVGPNAWYWIFMRDVTPGHEEAEFTQLTDPVTSPSWTGTGLQHNHTYEFKVASTSRGGESEPSAAVQATARYPTPAAPSGLVVKPGDGQVDLTWTASSTPNVWYWVYYRNVSPNKEEADFTRNGYPATTTSAQLGGLANGDTYEFKVTAINQAGESAPSNLVRARPLPPLPGQPTDLAATPGTDGTVKLTWTAPGPNLWYWVWMRDVGTNEPLRNLGLVTTTSWTGTGLEQDHVYEFRVGATNVAGDGALSPAVRATAHYDPPPAPTNLRVVTSGSGTVALDWDATGPNLYYWIYVRDIRNTQFTKSGYPTDQTNASWGNLEDGQTYEFKISAQNPGGEGPASTPVRVVARAQLPAPPTNLRASAGDAQVRLDWTASTTPGVWYLVYYRPVGQSWQQVGYPVSSGTTYTVTGLANGQAYEFKVTSTNSAGDSGPSNVVTATPTYPVPAPPTNLAATPYPTGVWLQWTASTTPGSWYWVEYRATDIGQAWQRLPQPLAGNTSFAFGGLSAFTYEFRIRSTNAGGISGPSNVVAARPLPPLPPGGLTATAGVSHVTLRWNASPTPKVWYLVEYRDATANGSWQRHPYPITGATSFTMGSLTSHRYDFRVRATAPSGDSSPTNVASATPLPPLPPSQLLIESGDARATLRWNASPTPNVWYWIYYRDVTNCYCTAWQRILHKGGTVFDAQYLWNFRIYEFKVTAVGASGESSSTNTAHAYPRKPPPSPPYDLVAWPGPRSVSMTWHGSLDSDVHYRVYGRDRKTRLPYRVYSFPTGCCSYTARYLITGRVYDFYVVAVDSYGQESAPTNVAYAYAWPG